jgi:hypothetical protein
MVDMVMRQHNIHLFYVLYCVKRYADCSLHTSSHQATRKTNECYAAALPRSPHMKTRILTK